MIQFPKKKKVGINPQKQNIVLIHHGEDVRDVEKEVGGTKATNLTDQGEKDIKDSVSKIKYEGVKKVYTSPIERAMQSARIIQEKTMVKVEIKNGLGSWRIGNFDGMERGKFEKAQEYFVHNPSKLIYPPIPDHKLKESFGEFKNRVIKTYNDISAKGEPNIGLLTHSKNIKVINATKKHNGWNKEAKDEFCDHDNQIESAEVIIKKSKKAKDSMKIKHNP